MKKAVTLFAVLFTLITITMAQSKNKTSEKQVVSNMLAAFGKGDMEALKNTLAEHTVWTYHGTDAIPYSGTYKGKDGVMTFFGNITGNTEILDFKIHNIIAEGNTVVVLGFEKQKIKKNRNILEQNWVQVYTVEQGLITKMEEYANTAHAAVLFSQQ